MSERYRTAERILENFPHPIISRIVGQPNYETLAEVHLKLNTNAASIHENIGNGKLGLMFLTVKPQVHATMSSGVLFMLPNGPGQHPTTSAGASRVSIAEIRCLRQVAVDGFKMYQNIDKSLKNQLIAVLDETCISTK